MPQRRGGSTSSGGGHGGATTSAGGSGGTTAGPGGAAGSGGSGGMIPGGVKTESGSRLKRMFGLGDDGAEDLTLVEMPWGLAPYIYNSQRPQTQWWDSQRKETCAYQTAADGVLRCLPLDDDSAYRGVKIYLDPQCKQPVVVVTAAGPGCPQPIPKYGTWLETPQACPPPNSLRQHVYTVGALVGNQNCFYNDLTPGQCNSNGCLGGQYAVYALGPEVPASSFVAGTPQRDP